MTNLLKNLSVIIVLLAVIIGASWYLLRTPVADETEIGMATTDLTSTDNPANEFYALLTKLNSVDFQGGKPIFDNPIFRFGLTDYTSPLPTIDQSRPNPFAPLEANTSVYVHYAKPLMVIVPSATTTATSTR